jgi:pyruvate ferredoxin oxidoreductase delta subunit
MIEKRGWNDFDPGVILFSFEKDKKVTDIATTLPEDRPYSESNSYTSNQASEWRVVKPVYNRDYCIDCQFCWIYCPDMSIISRDKEMKGIDMDHCKGCGICVEVCPTNPKSLLMFQETEDEKKALSEWPEKEDKKEEE